MVFKQSLLQKYQFILTEQNLVKSEGNSFPITTTDNKINLIDKENTFFKSYIKPSSTDQVVGVVGKVEGLWRHIVQFRDLGYEDKNIFLFESKERMYNELKNGDSENLGMDKLRELEQTQAHLIYSSILTPRRPYITHHFGNIFNPDSVTHADLDFTETIDPAEEINILKNAFTVYPNLKSVLLVRSTRGQQIRSDIAMKDIGIGGKYEKLNSLIRYLGGRSTEFKNLYDYYITTQAGEKSGKDQFLNKLQSEFSNASFLIQSYPGAPTKPGGQSGQTMLSIAIVKDTKEPIMDVQNSYFKKGFSKGEKPNFNTQYNAFKKFINKANTHEGFKANENELISRGLKPLTVDDYIEYEVLMDELYTFSSQ